MSPEREPIILESAVPLSQSVIWRLQREYYAQRGLRAWTEDMVPQYITNNPFIAAIYARIVFGFVRDCMDPANKDASPLRIVELGAGPGKFSYLFLRHLIALLQTENIAPETVRYCMTDSAASLLEAWRANRYLAEFVELGILRFEAFEAGSALDHSFTFGEPSESVPSGSGPLVVIANYVFDSLPQDAFVIQQERLFEALVTTTSGGGTATPPKKLSDLQLSFKNVTVDSHRYVDAAWNAILEQYRSRLPGATVFFPAEALKTIQQLDEYAESGLLVLAADKGCAHEDTLQLTQGPPTLEMHASGQCFSQMVNFDAIGKYFENTGGRALLPEKHSASLNLCGFLRGQPTDRFSATRAAYEEAQSAFAPDDLFALLGWLDPHLDSMSIPQILAVLRLSHWDPVALMRLFPAIARQARSVTSARHDLRNAVLNTWANHFPVTANDNVMAFQCAVVLLELRFYEDALPLFRTSEQVLGRSAPTSYNLGLCCLGLGKQSDALAYMVEACNLDPTFEPARTSRQKLEAGDGSTS